MKILFTALLFLCLSTPLSPAKAEEGVGTLFGNYSDYASEKHKERKAAKKRHQSALKRRKHSDDTNFEETTYDNPFEKSEPYFKEKKIHKDDRYIKLKNKKAKNKLDTWGRNGGQTKSSEEVLKDMMSPAKK